MPGKGSTILERAQAGTRIGIIINSGRKKSAGSMREDGISDAAEFPHTVSGKFLSTIVAMPNNLKSAGG